MKLKATEVYSLLSKIIELINKENNWIEKIPSEISSVFFDNPSVTFKGRQIDCLIEFIFGDLNEDVCYFLYESAPHKITTSKGDYVINNIKEYVEYLIREDCVINDME